MRLCHCALLPGVNLKSKYTKSNLKIEIHSDATSAKYRNPRNPQNKRNLHDWHMMSKIRSMQFYRRLCDVNVMTVSR